MEHGNAVLVGLCYPIPSEARKRGFSGHMTYSKWKYFRSTTKDKSIISVWALYSKIV